jgi:Tol biopolymer transport system component
MKLLNFFFCLLISIILVNNNLFGEADWPVLKGPYLGQKPPGLTPELFGPGVISTNHHEGCLNFTPDGKECFFVVGGHPFYLIATMRMGKNQWTKPQVAPFSGKYRDWDFNLSPDGDQLFYTSYRPRSGKGEPADNNNIWVVTRKGDSWSEPRCLDFPVNTDGPEGHPTVSRNGTLYFHHRPEGEKAEWAIYSSLLLNGKYTKPKKISKAVNWSGDDYDPFIAPDESYLIFCSAGQLAGKQITNFYVSFRKKDGTWCKAINMGEKIKKRGSCPAVSPDGKYFFFNSYQPRNKEYSEVPLTYKQKIKLLDTSKSTGGVYWVDAGIIKQLKPKELR